MFEISKSAMDKVSIGLITMVGILVAQAMIPYLPLRIFIVTIPVVVFSMAMYVTLIVLKKEAEQDGSAPIEAYKKLATFAIMLAMIGASAFPPIWWVRLLIVSIPCASILSDSIKENPDEGIKL